MSKNNLFEVTKQQSGTNSASHTNLESLCETEKNLEKQEINDKTMKLVKNSFKL